MNSPNLIITLEPEAASAWCKRLPSSGFLDDGFEDEALQQKPGTQYIVVDCGGGTIDIAVHQILEKGYLKEIRKASGGNMGGGSVDDKFQSVFREIFHPTLWDEYIDKYPSELQNMLFDFSMIKCVGNEEDVYIPCPTNLRRMAEEQKSMQEYLRCVKGVSWLEGSFKITHSKLKTFFTESLKKITRYLNAIFATPEINIDFIFLVGGYSSCEILQTEMKKQFGCRCRILCPADANLAVAKGAVLMGRDPKIISSRVCALTYGISEGRPFDPSVHKIEKRRENKTKDYVFCTDLFHRFVHKGESVTYEEEREYYFSPVDDDQTLMSFTIYSTESLNGEYIDDPGMKQIGTFTVSMPDITNGRNRRVKYAMKFGLTEMEATATDVATGETKSIRLDFLRK